MRSFLFPFLLIGLAILVSQNEVLGKSSLRTEKQLFSQFLKYATRKQTNNDLVEFQKILEILSLPHYIYREPLSSYSLWRVQLTCVACRSAVDIILALHQDGSTEQELADVITNLCILMNIQTETICRGLVELNLPIITYIVDNQPAFSTNTFCGILLQTNNKTSCPYEDERFEWTVDIPSKELETEPPATGNSSFKIVQISDLHYDPIYEANGLAVCNEPTCCRRGQTEKASPKWKSLYIDESLEHRITRDKNGEFLLDLDYAYEVREAKALKEQSSAEDEIPEGKRAGFWGDYRDCDSPWWAIEDSINRIVETQSEFDYVYYTGDMIDHGVWETTQEGNTKTIKETLNLLRDTFGTTPVFSAIGNHESQPLNQFAPSTITDPRFSTAWLYNLLVAEWGTWLPADTAASIKEGGYYTTLVKPGLRIVALNSNLCYRYNWWIHLEPNDPSGQLKWLTGVLAQAEADKEIVHILSHIPPGITDCVSTYTREYRRVIERFSDTIAAEFNGHTHNDEFKVFYAKDNIDKPVAVAWNGGSITTYSNVNPNYKVYDVDINNYEVVDIETWVYNLTEANETPDKRPRWYKEYSFKEHYGLSSLSLDSIEDLFQRMVTTQQNLLVKDYHIFRGKDSDPYNNRVCNTDCIKDNLRYLATTELYDDRKFNALWNTFLANNSTNNK